MPMLGPDDLPELDQRLTQFVERLLISKKPTPDDVKLCRSLLAWLIYDEWEETEELDMRPIAWSECLSEQERQNLATLAFAARQFVTERNGAAKTGLIDMGRTMLEIRGLHVVTPGKRKDILDKKVEARDHYIYERLCKGYSAERIAAAIDQHPEWDSIPPEELHHRANEYAQRHELPSVAERVSSRK